MKETILFAQYLEAAGYDLSKLNFNEAVALYKDVQKVLEKAFEDKGGKAIAFSSGRMYCSNGMNVKTKK